MLLGQEIIRESSDAEISALGLRGVNKGAVSSKTIRSHEFNFGVIAQNCNFVLYKGRTVIDIASGCEDRLGASGAIFLKISV